MSTTGRDSGILESAYQRFVALRGTPGDIARGFALGLFIGMSPYMMCHTVTAVFVASLMKWNKLAAAAGVFITNPVTAPFFYAITFRVGAVAMPETSSRVALPVEFSVEALTALLKSGPEILWILTIGGIVAGIPVALAGYVLVYRLMLTCRMGR